MLDHGFDLGRCLLDACLQHLFGDLFFVEDDHFLDVAHAALEVFAEGDDLANDDRGAGDGLHDADLPALYAFRDLDFAFAREERDGAHLA